MARWPLWGVSLTALTLATSISQAEDATPQGAAIKVSNESTWTLDCRVVSGPNLLAFNNIAPGASSDPRAVSVSGSQRTAICKKRGATPTPKTTSQPLQFSVKEPGNLTLKCTHPDSDPDRLACAVSKD